MRIVKRTVLGMALAAFTAGAALACAGHPGGHAQSQKPDTEQSTVTSDKK
ncbi:MAG: hypothetical protein JNM29_06810 [Candidatus Odyssella sp.]|nr:hypothetical protein [Candidatus Odyssella sp.]